MIVLLAQQLLISEWVDMKNMPKILILPILSIVGFLGWTMVISTGMGWGPSRAISALILHKSQPVSPDSITIERESKVNSAEIASKTAAEPESSFVQAPAAPPVSDTIRNPLAELMRQKSELEKPRDEVGGMLRTRARSDSASLGSQAKMHKGLEPSLVAAVIANMGDCLVISIIPRLKARKNGKILGSMPADRARISSKLAGLN